MNGKLKLLIGGLGIGILFVFALLGLKSLFVDEPKTPAQPETSNWQPSQASTYYTGNIPTIGASDGEKVATQRDVQQADNGNDKIKPQLINEQNEPNTTPSTAKPATNTALNTARPGTTANPATTQPIQQPVTPQPSTLNNGGLEIIAQSAENNSPIAANIYVQKTDGTNVDAAAATAQTSFSLKPGLYKITVRANGRASVSRNLTVPPKAIVSEIFALPLAAAPQPTQPVEPTQPVTPPPPPVAEPQDNIGKLRVVALSADDGSPLKVDFTVREPDGTVLNHARNVSMAEMTLPAQKVVVSFTFRDFTGEQSLTVKPNQTVTHTFNLRGTNNAPPADNGANNTPASGANNPAGFNDFLNGMQTPPRN